MNPSTEDFVSAIGKVNADHIIILPNNSNIVLAANQACQVCEDKDIHVLPTKTIPQGLSACIMFNPEVDIEDNLAEMQEAIDHVKSGEVTYAIKIQHTKAWKSRKMNIWASLESHRCIGSRYDGFNKSFVRQNVR